jgi:hypothetical protein
MHLRVGYTYSRPGDEPMKIQYNGNDKAFLPVAAGAYNAETPEDIAAAEEENRL